MNTLRRGPVILVWGLIAAVVLGGREPAKAALPTPTQRLGACTPEMVRGDELYASAGGLRVLVTRFVGQDEPSQKMGAELAYTLSQELPEYTRKSLQIDAQAAGLADGDMQVQYVPCLLSSHPQARQVGQAWGADLVFWGQASCSRSDVASCKLSPVVGAGAQVQVEVHGAVESKRKAQIGVIDNRRVTVTTPPPSGMFKTSVTLVKWRGLQGRSDRSVEVDPARTTDLDFPRLASERPLALFRWAVGVYAFYSQKYALAAARFEEAAAELYAGAEDRSDLYRVMGTSLLFAGNAQRGLEALEQARASCAGSDTRCLDIAMTNLGWALDRLGDKQKALSYFEQVLQLQKQAGDRAGEATTLNNIGRVYSALGDKQKALSYFELALPLQNRVGNRAGAATTLNNIGAVYDDLGDKQKALSYYELALPLLKQVGNLANEATTLNNIGHLYDGFGDKQKALSYYEMALLLQKQVGDRMGEATSLDNIGGVYFAFGDKHKALSHFELALSLQKQVGDRTGEAATLNNIGAVYDDLGDKHKALSHFELALPLQKQVGDLAGEAATLNNVGRVHSQLGDKHKALSHYGLALPLLKQVGNRAGEATTLNNIGSVYSHLGDKHKALSYYELALLLRKQVGDRAGEAATLNNIGSVYSDLGDNQKALSYYEQALPLLKEVGNRAGEGITLDNLAGVLAELGRFGPAIQRYREASACYLARRPPDVEAAVGSVGLAFGVALRSRLWPEASAVLAELEALKPAPVALARWRAQFAGHSAAPDAVSRYHELGRLAATLPPKAQTHLRMQAQAGERRAQKKLLFGDCAGVVITEVVADSQAARLGLLAGDIVLRYQSQCIGEPSKLIDLVRATQPSQTPSLVLVRSDGTRTVSLQGGRIGIATSDF